MSPHRSFASRPRTDRSAVACRCRVLRAIAALGLAVLLFGLAVPLVGVLADEPAPFCCSKGRCCCADVARSTDEAPCLRRGCGCGHSDELVPGAPLRFEAVLPAAEPVAVSSAGETRWRVTAQQSIARAQEPTVPPPKRPRPA